MSLFFNTATQKVAALSRSQAIIEFSLDGTILHANENFLKAMGYNLEELKGKHHSIFVDIDYAQSQEYRDFWAKLNRGEYDVCEYKRFGKGGREVWIQASYNPVLNAVGKPVSVIKIATEITEQKLHAADMEGQIDAINKSQAVIHFTPEGRILEANQNFLQVMGYSLAEIKGQHHSMFAEPTYAASADYRMFWERLACGEYQSAEYKRLGKNGREVWIQASYNPIFDMNGHVFKVVKYATDITAQKLKNVDIESQIAAIHKSQAVIEFSMDGRILTANYNFLHAMGYSLGEIQGQHHSMFADSDYTQSSAYRDFWAALNRGEYQASVYKRLGKGGKIVWIQASYNPIIDLNGKPFKVVKYATDITAAVEARLNATHYAQSTSANVQAVAAASEELSASVGEISSNMNRSLSLVEEIAQRADSAVNATQELNNASAAMDNIVNLIREIAGQINLLALNATIESARAGDAGRGFAVVAGEVKSLAGQTTKATEEISSNISTVQNLSNAVSEILQSIDSSVTNIRQFVSGVAGAIEEQTAVTRDISSNMQMAAVGVSSISQQLTELERLAS